MKKIDETKKKEFKMTYDDGEYLYIAKGYGMQETGGYSISVRNLYLTPNTIVFCTELMGPKKMETVSKSPSFPYIVLRTEVLEKNVLFE